MLPSWIQNGRQNEISIAKSLKQEKRNLVWRCTITSRLQGRNSPAVWGKICTMEANARRAWLR